MSPFRSRPILQYLIHFKVIFLGRDGDPNQAQRPAWVLDGTFLAFRLLQQRILKCNDDIFLFQNAPQINDPAVSGSELLGARFTGRWKSGAPIALTPLHGDVSLACDKLRNNKFNYDPTSQDACPFRLLCHRTLAA
ncbi:hypothetical protein GQ53DRAFT_631083 [Thozetella sp. PMI_491]|nr:hypothetical protein GQ53DRAFT_631083 [Thozetella sp. PMI_491]